MQRIASFASALTCLALLSACAATQDGSTGWGSGSGEKKIGENRYSIRAGTNAANGPPRLKPLLLQKAAEVAQREGATGFVVLDPYFGKTTHGDQNEVESLVALVRSTPSREGPFEYFSLPLRKLDAANGTADLVASTTVNQPGEYKVILHAFYLDVLDQKNKAMGPVTYVIPQGPQVIGINVLVFKGTIFTRLSQTSVIIRPTVKRDRKYRIGGIVSGENLTVWLEDTESSERFSTTEVSLRDA